MIMNSSDIDKSRASAHTSCVFVAKLYETLCAALSVIAQRKHIIGARASEAISY